MPPTGGTFSAVYDFIRFLLSLIHILLVGAAAIVFYHGGRARPDGVDERLRLVAVRRELFGKELKISDVYKRQANAFGRFDIHLGVGLSHVEHHGVAAAHLLHHLCLLYTSRCVIRDRDTDVLIIPANVIAALKEKNLHVRCFLYELATKRFSDVMWAMQQIMFKGLDQRLAEFLFAEAERTGSDTIRMTHEQIAQHISSAREAVARVLKSFSEDGLVELKR